MKTLALAGLLLVSNLTATAAQPKGLKGFWTGPATLTETEEADDGTIKHRVTGGDVVLQLKVLKENVTLTYGFYEKGNERPTKASEMFCEHNDDPINTLNCRKLKLKEGVLYKGDRKIGTLCETALSIARTDTGNMGMLEEIGLDKNGKFTDRFVAHSETGVGYTISADLAR